MHENEDIFKILFVEILSILEFELDLGVGVELDVVVYHLVEVGLVGVDWVQGAGHEFC